MSQIVTLERRGDIEIITIDNPPVNVFSHAVRAALMDAFDEADASDSRAIVLRCAGRTYVAGADITEFGKPPQEPLLPDLLNRIENCSKPVIAALHGTALGGGLESAIASHYRIAVPDARLGFPEVLLGLLPGAGGTQRVPRLMGVEVALDFILAGKPISADAALASGLIDRIAAGNLLEAALAYAQELADNGAVPRCSSKLPIDLDSVAENFFEQKRAAVARKTRGVPAPQRIIDCVEAATKLDFRQGSAFEREKFVELMNSPESAGLRHVFFAERQASKIEGIARNTPLRPVNSVGIIGAGTMGGGIAMNFANAGIAVTLLELNTEALDRGIGICRKNYQRSAAKGRFTPEQVEHFMGLISGTTSYEDLTDVDLVIEAVFEDPQIKYEVFRKLDAVCKPGAILASNTSYQDIDAIAAVTSRAQDVLGMHFFSPANVMKLLEVVRGEKTADDVLATVMKLAKKIRKVAVLSRVGYGFIGNRMLGGYFREAQMLLLEGATPSQVDGAMQSFGMAMGPLAVGDLAGLDIGYKARQALPDRPDHPATHVADQLVEMGRLGQKTGAGYYRYDAETRKRLVDPEVEALIRAEAGRLAIEPRTFSDEEIVARVIYPLINEGARVLEEGIAQRASDIDIVYIYGYGFPAHRGGPMFYADTVGAKAVYDRICEFRDTLRADDWQPAPLLEKLAADNGRFNS
ncbi:MAG: enoyl-CoA hydratase/isomerase family protein [Proteobacteria bacterium]|nr:enoyl-CoA hydratase/isomerase family protein [Pseudomonadota bacterium]